ncbi:MAG: pyridoxal phosphate-dependent decarboxylase family protein [Planctomycetota bacterium]|jgi:glutamate/tyrosine decarboxylase-like PLP-dependent enzyme
MDLPREDFLALLNRASQISEAHYNQRPEQIADPEAVPRARQLFSGDLPNEPTTPDALLDRIENEVLPNCVHTPSPAFLNFITSCGNPYGIAANLISSAINSPILRESVGPAATAIELQSVRWISQFIGYPENADGILVSGGSMANFVGLAMAVNEKAPGKIRETGLSGLPPMTIYASMEAHLCIQKAMEVLGLGSEQLRLIEVDARFRMDVQALKESIAWDRAKGMHPIAVVAQGGAVNTGAIDPLNELADLCAREKLWLHVDGAYGAPAAGTDLCREEFVGIERADSLAVDAHKWFYVPFTAGFILAKQRGSLEKRFSAMADYAESTLQDDRSVNFMERGLQMSRDFGSLKVWMTFVAYGAEQLRRAIEDNVQTMRHLEELIAGTEEFESLNPCNLSVLCLRYLGTGTCTEVERERLNLTLFERIEADGLISCGRVKIQGHTALRLANVKYRTGKKEIERVFEIIKDSARSLDS